MLAAKGPEFEELRLGDAVYRWQDGQLRDAHGCDVALRAKSLKMFAALLSERDKVLSKDRLSELVWPDTVATDESIARCVADIRKALRDDTYDIVQTYPKQGYRLNVSTATRDRRTPPWQSSRWLAAGVAALALLVGLNVAMDRDRALTSPSPSVIETPLRNTVAILPFKNDGGADPFLAAGLTDDLEIHLSEMSDIRILSQAQTQALAGMSLAPVDLARSLDTRYVILGSLRQSGSRIALSIQLIDGTDGATLWADRYEGTRSGLLSFRATVPEALVAAMSLELNARDRERLAFQDTNSPDAFDFVMGARRELSLFTYEGSLAAEKLLRRAIAIDPQYARAYAELASAFAVRMENDWIVLSQADTQKAFYFAERALELDPGLWFSHYALGRLHSVSPDGDIETALSHLATAMELHPSDDDARIYYAIVMMMSGRLDEARAILESVLATHPAPPFWYHLGYANVLFHMNEYDASLAALEHCLSQMPNSPYCLRTQVAALARLGRVDDAEWALAEYAILGHDTSLESFMRGSIERDPAMLKHMRESYQLAGIE